jgi:hypothetical protein
MKFKYPLASVAVALIIIYIIFPKILYFALIMSGIVALGIFLRFVFKSKNTNP